MKVSHIALALCVLVATAAAVHIDHDDVITIHDGARNDPRRRPGRPNPQRPNPQRPTPAPTLSIKVTSDEKAANEKAHRTDMVRGSDGVAPQKEFLLLRRCQDFTLKLDKKADDKFALKDLEGKKKASTALRVKSSDATTTVLTSPENACNSIPVGKYTLTYDGKDLLTVFILFNPWVQEDFTFVPEAKTRFDPEVDEHVLNEFGGVWQGSATRNGFATWSYGQFDVLILNRVDKILQALTHAQRATPTLVTRWLSTRINMELLEGNWSGKYEEGTSPSVWRDSASIFKDSIKANRATKFGQCWVFASLLTTIGRALGIATRSVSNFDSAHERRDPKTKEFDLNCNVFYDYDATKDSWSTNKEKSDASVWNFHVWNEMFFKRTDVKDGDGWQAVDSTYQELTSGPFEAPFGKDMTACGPSSLAHLRADLGRAGSKAPGYDVAFVGGQTNCVLTEHWENKDKKGYQTLPPNKDKVGKIITTKASDKFCRGATKNANGYESMCSANVHELYVKPGTFLFAELHSSLYEKHKANLLMGYDVSVSGGSDGSGRGSLLAVGSSFKAELIAAAGAEEAGEWYIQVAATGERGLTDHVSIAVQKGKGAGASIDLKDYWATDKMKAALKRFKTISITFRVASKDGLKLYVQHIPIELSDHVLSVKCESAKVGVALKCTATAPSSLVLGATKLNKVKATIVVSSQVNSDSNVVSASVDAKDGVFSFGPLSHPLTTAGKSLVAITVTSDDFMPLHGSTFVDISA